MGYSEVLCHICGVSFNIGRIRTANEPRSAAWARWGPMMNENPWHPRPEELASWVPNHIYHGRLSDGCNRESGCMFAVRNQYSYLERVDMRFRISAADRAKEITDAISKDDRDDEDDEDWDEEENAESIDPLEFLSDAAADEELDKEGLTTDEDVDMQDASDCDAPSVSREELRDLWFEGLLGNRATDDREGRDGGFGRFVSDYEGMAAWYRGIPAHITLPDPDDVQDEFRPCFEPGRDTMVEPIVVGSDPPSRNHWGRQGEPEHIAGPGCRNKGGYKGHEISAEEMRCCQTSQCLVRKPKGWTFESLPDDEKFEKSGEFFLSGLSDHMPSRDYGIPRVTPARHGCDQPHAENKLWDENQAYDYALPFHPSCFEIYKRASTLQNGTVDVTGLTSWWSLEADYELFQGFPRDPNVDKCAHQEWEHMPGTAYLVANPLYVPTLEAIFEQCISEDLSFHPRNGAFDLPETFARQPTNDPFAILPAELRYQILENLPSKDIAALRLSVRSFCQIPVSYFQKLLRHEMPWLWEAWPTPKQPAQAQYSKWATGTAAEVARTLQKPDKQAAILKGYVNIITKEMPELGPMLEEALPARLQEVQDAWQEESQDILAKTPFYLPPGRTNYFKLYTLITRHWKELRGLQNRKRIWTDCQEILRRIEVYKSVGKVDENGIVGKLEDVILHNQRESQRLREERHRQWLEGHEERQRAAAANPRVSDNWT